MGWGKKLKKAVKSAGRSIDKAAKQTESGTRKVLSSAKSVSDKTTLQGHYFERKKEQRREGDRKAHEAGEQAKADVLKRTNQARKATVYSETTGQGLGSVGSVQLGVSDSEEEEELNLRQGRSAVRL